MPTLLMWFASPIRCRRSFQLCGDWSRPLPPAQRVRRTCASKSNDRHEQIASSPTNVSANERPTTRFTKEQEAPLDHQSIGIRQDLWTIHPLSHGSPIFTPEGTHVFQRLQDLVRAQYPAFGFQEVISPMLYKKELWQKSGHWENYKDDMFMVSSSKERAIASNIQAAAAETNTVEEDATFGLKPMNCPGHCLLFAHKTRSYRDLPIRYADFSPLHRDEISGSLSGLTRVRRFHQDDGHIFCRPDQVQSEIVAALKFMDTIYNVLDVKDYRLAISTRPERDYIGTEEEWAMAESQLRDALSQSGFSSIEYQKGEGAFYGPKIDAITRDSNGKDYQIGTVQLDFQLPKRFRLQYDTATPSQKQTGSMPQTQLAEAAADVATPIMIHRAILGSLERFMALYMEDKKGAWPFWLSPYPAILLPVKNTPEILAFSFRAAKQLSNGDVTTLSPRRMYQPYHKIDIDDREESLSKRVASAKAKGYTVILIVGEANVKGDYLDLDMSKVPDQSAVQTIVREVLANASEEQVTSEPALKSKGRGMVQLSLAQAQQVMRLMVDQYV